MLPLQLLNVIVIIVMLYFVIDLVAAGQSDSKLSPAGGMAAHDGLNSMSGPNTPEYGSPGLNPVSVASGQEGNSLLFIREKGMLVRDFYREMYHRWNAEVFKDLIEDENRHLAAVSVAIPKELNFKHDGVSSPGKRFNTVFPKIAGRGEQSLEDAIVAGVMMEMWALSDVLEMEDKCCTDELRNFLSGVKSHCCNHIRIMKENLCRAA